MDKNRAYRPDSMSFAESYMQLMAEELVAAIEDGRSLRLGQIVHPFNGSCQEQAIFIQNAEKYSKRDIWPEYVFTASRPKLAGCNRFDHNDLGHHVSIGLGGISGKENHILVSAHIDTVFDADNVPCDWGHDTVLKVLTFVKIPRLSIGPKYTWRVIKDDIEIKSGIIDLEDEGKDEDKGDGSFTVIKFGDNGIGTAGDPNVRLFIVDPKTGADVEVARWN
ncbi:hypothetical protein HJFPF1_10417 [Paramyrothecium foliicola]|nr:hypothetical protein HJFPF1_10417 [Paramyrothecium foliicola]